MEVREMLRHPFITKYQDHKLAIEIMKDFKEVLSWDGLFFVFILILPYYLYKIFISLSKWASCIDLMVHLFINLLKRQFIQKDIHTCKINHWAGWADYWAFFTFILFCRAIIFSLATSLSFLQTSTLCSLSTFFLSSTKYWLLHYLESLSYFSTISLASFILCTPFSNSSLHWSMVLAEFSNEVEYSGNFFVFRYNDNFLSKLPFSLVEYSLLISVIYETSVYKDWSLTISSSFYFLTSSSFSSAFFLKSTSRLCIFYYISFFLAWRVTF